MMITNDQMTAGRFECWAKNRASLRRIQQHLANDGRVQVSTYTRSTVYSQKHAALFGCGKTAGLWVMSGKQRTHIGFSSIRFI